MPVIQEIAKRLYQPFTQTLPLEWATVLMIQGLLAGLIILQIARIKGKDSFEIKDGITISGIVSLSFLFLIDYLSFKGLKTTTYVAEKITQVADLTMFFAFLTLAWILWTYQWPGKYEVFQKITG